MNTWLTPLFEAPDRTEAVKITIEPLAPLSMVEAVPGSYYRSLKAPSDFMLMGMLENMLGWRFSPEHRKTIFKKMEKTLKKSKSEIQKVPAPSGFQPLLQNHLSIDQLSFYPQTLRHDDYWTMHLKGGDMRHLNGARNYDYRLETEMNALGDAQKERDDFFKAQQGRFANYYPSPTKREYVAFPGKERRERIYQFKAWTTSKLADLLVEKAEAKETPLYLGHSEGWVEVDIEKL